MPKRILFFIFETLILLSSINRIKSDDMFKAEIGDKMEIGIADKGYKSVQLECFSDSMLINLETEDDFYGVIYTRGSYHEKSSSCFIDPGNKRGQRSFSIKFSLNECNTKKIGEKYINTVVVQYDKELIMPGDMAFKLECDFNYYKEMENNDIRDELNVSVKSTISLSGANPSVEIKEDMREQLLFVENNTGTVILKSKTLSNNHQEFKKEL